MNANAQQDFQNRSSTLVGFRYPFLKVLKAACDVNQMLIAYERRNTFITVVKVTAAIIKSRMKGCKDGNRIKANKQLMMTKIPRKTPKAIGALNSSAANQCKT